MITTIVLLLISKITLSDIASISTMFAALATGTYYIIKIVRMKRDNDKGN